MFYKALSIFYAASLLTNQEFFKPAHADLFTGSKYFGTQKYECSLEPCPDVLIVYDVSGTVKQNAQQRFSKSLEYLHSAVEDGNNSFAIVTFATKPAVSLPFTRDKEIIHKSLNSIKPYPLGTPAAWTNMDSGLKNAWRLINKEEKNGKVITLVFSDFRPDSPKSPRHEIQTALKEAENLRNSSLRFYPIAFAGRIRIGVLRQMGGAPPHRSYTADEFKENPPKLCYKI